MYLQKLRQIKLTFIEIICLSLLFEVNKMAAIKNKFLDIFKFNLTQQELKGQLMRISDSFTILGLWVLGLAVSNINESQLQTYESKTLFLMISPQYYCIPGLARTR